MLKRMSLIEERDHWSLLSAASLALVQLHRVLSHPSLDLSLQEREEVERDAQALYALLPDRVQRRIDAEREDYTGAASGVQYHDTPF